ncbi:hypothetical protein EBU94_05145 [bacterium]|nr:hypothetical protein [bacterium]
MNAEEKLIRYIASKLIQKKFFLRKGFLPDEKTLEYLIRRVLNVVKEEYRQYNLVRGKSESGLITPIIEKIVQELKIL